MPHFGHAALSAPILGQKRAKQAKHLTSPSLLPVMTLSIFMMGTSSGNNDQRILFNI
jgi:hypothetical protein